MCGIAGIIGRDPSRVRDAVTRMTAAMTHRGPDADGIAVLPFGNLWLGLGHRRLSIIDLSPLGAQPMTHEPSGCQIVFNGEIYNFHELKRGLISESDTFRGGSDTEVMLAGLARHGPRYCERFEGMYAYALYDPRNGGSLTLTRDPAGIKPLYMAHTPEGLVFASEVRALLSSGLLPKKVDGAALAGLLAYGAIQQPLSLFEGVRMLPPGSHTSIRTTNDNIAIESPVVWWMPPEPDPTPVLDVVGTVRDNLDAAVRDHLMSDVPVGVFLSAGLDSSTIAGLAARHSKAVQAFTVGFTDQPDFDEMTIASETALRFGISHTPIRLSNSDAEQAAHDWLADADQPSMDGLNTYIIAKAVRACGVKVALSGLGADELFGGYPSFREVPKLRRLSKAVGWLPQGMRRGLAGMLAVRKSTTARAKLADMLAGCGDVTTLALQRRRALNDRQLAALGLDRDALGLSPDWLPSESAVTLPRTSADPGWAISVVESRFYQTNVLLRDSDTNGMAHGLEIRVPFLDQRLLNQMHRLPGSIRFPTNRPPKWLLREAAADVLHPNLLARPKSGFALPLRRWMTGPLRTVCEAGLATLKATGLVKGVGVDAVWNDFLREPESPAWSRALTLAATGDFLRRHG